MSKKIICVILSLVFICLAMTGCGGKETVNITTAANNDTVDYEITEKLYVTSINDIYTNTSDYLGKVIRIEGMYSAETIGANTYHYVYRTGPGCCGNDGAMCGFEFVWDGEMPNENDWIRVTGVLMEYYEDTSKYLHIVCNSLEYPETRGLEVVGN